MICLKSPKSSEFANFVNKQWSKILNYADFIILTTIQLIFENRKQPLGFEATEHLRNRTREENCRNVIMGKDYVQRFTRRPVYTVYVPGVYELSTCSRRRPE